MQMYEYVQDESDEGREPRERNTRKSQKKTLKLMTLLFLHADERGDLARESIKIRPAKLRM